MIVKKLIRIRSMGIGIINGLGIIKLNSSLTKLRKHIRRRQN